MKKIAFNCTGDQYDKSELLSIVITHSAKVRVSSISIFSEKIFLAHLVSVMLHDFFPLLLGLGDTRSQTKQLNEFNS